MYRRFGDPSWDAADGIESSLSGAVAATVEPRGFTPRIASRRRSGWSHAPRGAAPRVSTRKLPTVTLRGLNVHAITEAQCVQHIIDELKDGFGGMVVTPNLDHLRRYGHDVNFGALVSEADLVVADGMPLVWASRLQGTPLPERVAGSNLISSLSAAAAAAGRSIYLLGGAAGAAQGAAEVLKTRSPALKVAGAHYPPFGFENDAQMMASLIEDLAAARPDIVFVALGSPKQERLIARLRHVLPQAWWLGVGNSFSFLAGDVRRAPLWMQRRGLEWVHRLGQEPRRLFKRYLVSGVPFAGMLLCRSALAGVPARLRRRKALAPDAASPVVLAPAIVPSVEPPLPAILNESVVAPLAAAAALSVTVTDRPLVANSKTAALSRLRALVLLGGSVRPTALSQATARSTLDLPLDENGSLLNHWLASALDVARLIGLEKLPVRVMVNHGSHEPTSADPKYYGTFRVERDQSEYRGTGGVLRDIAADYEDDDLILVANGRQIPLDPMPALVQWLRKIGGDVGVVAHEDGTPSGLMLLRCQTLRLIADTGFVDMKEQALPRIGQEFDVRIGWRRRPTGLPIRSLEDYILALRCYHRRRAGKSAAIDPLGEDWSSSFALIEPGATVDPSARIHDSVVLAGAWVEPGAVVVRSVVCADGVVRSQKSTVDQIVCPTKSRTAPRMMTAPPPAGVKG